MRSLIVSFSDTEGGAARAASRLHRSLQEASGVESMMLVRRKSLDDPMIVGEHSMSATFNGKVRPRIDTALGHLSSEPETTFRSSNAVPSLWSRTIRRLAPDVVNTHWIGAGAFSIRDIGRIRHPLVMTLHDMWGFCGAEHYANEETTARWRHGYPKTRRSFGSFDVDSWTWERKKRSWNPATVVCPSEWLAGLAGASALMGEWPISVIPNPLDVTKFRPFDPAMARRVLGLPNDKSIVLFGAMGPTSDRRKGFDLLEQATHHLRDPSQIRGVVFGEPPQDRSSSPVPWTWMGQIEDDHQLALLYSAADAMVVPSRQENLVQTATEAQACGTPVIAFNTAGNPDAVIHNETGYLAEPFAPADLANGIDQILSNRDWRSQLGSTARTRAVRLWSPAVVASSYQRVYEQAIRHYLEPTARSGSRPD